VVPPRAAVESGKFRHNCRCGQTAPCSRAPAGIGYAAGPEVSHEAAATAGIHAAMGVAGVWPDGDRRRCLSDRLLDVRGTYRPLQKVSEPHLVTQSARRGLLTHGLSARGGG